MIDLISRIAWVHADARFCSAGPDTEGPAGQARGGTLGYESQQPAPVSESLMSPDNSGVRGADDSDTAVANC